MASASGKIILLGEHAVLYGHPAIACSIDRQVTVEVQRGTGEFLPSLSPVHRNKAQQAANAIALAANFLLETSDVSMKTDFPLAAGLGSSAAFCVAFARCIASEEAVVSLANQGETVLHGNASGIDVMTAAQGGFISFQNEHQVTQLDSPPLTVAVAFSGQEKSTKEQVSRVAGHPDRDEIVKELGAISQDAKAAGLNTQLDVHMNHSHSLLKRLGVSTPLLDTLRDAALSHGAKGAKLTGAGGGGCVIAIGDDPEAIVKHWTSMGFTAFSTRCGEKRC